MIGLKNNLLGEYYENMNNISISKTNRIQSVCLV